MTENSVGEFDGMTDGEMAMHLGGPSGVPSMRLKRQYERLMNLDVVRVGVGRGVNFNQMSEGDDDDVPLLDFEIGFFTFVFQVVRGSLFICAVPRDSAAFLLCDVGFADILCVGLVGELDVRVELAVVRHGMGGQG